VTSAVPVVNVASDTWQVAINRLNQLANLASNAMVTVSTSPTGSVSTGNATVNGIFQASTLAAGAALRGGTVSTPAALVITTNLVMGTIILQPNGFMTANAYTVAAASVRLDAAGLTVGNVVVTNSSITVGGVALVTNSAAATGAANGGVSVTRSRFNFVAGNNVTLTVTDDVGNNQVNVTISAVGGNTGSTVGGSNTYVQFNDSGAMGGATGMSWSKTANNLTVANTVYAPTIGIDSGQVTLNHIRVVTSGTTAQLIDSWSGSTYRTGFYQVSITNSSANGYSAAQLVLLFDGGDTHLEEFGTTSTNSTLGVWAANVSAGTVRLYFTPVSAAMSVRAQRTLIVV
jgi:hypothetical protein